MKYMEDNEVFLITGKHLNLCIWAIEKMMELFQEDDDMLIRFGRLRERLINKDSYSTILDKMGIPQAPPQEEIEMAQFLDKFGIKLPDDDDNKKTES